MSTYEPMGFGGHTEILTPCILCASDTLGTIITPRKLICDSREASEPLPIIKMQYAKLHICKQPQCRQKITAAAETLLDLQRKFNYCLSRELRPAACHQGKRPQPDEIIAALADFFPRFHIDLIHFTF